MNHSGIETMKLTLIDRTDRRFQEQGILRCRVENPLVINTKSAVRTHDPVQQIIKIGRNPPLPSRPWILRRQVTELQQIQSLWSQHMLTASSVKLRWSAGPEPEISGGLLPVPLSQCIDLYTTPDPRVSSRPSPPNTNDHFQKTSSPWL